MDLRMGIVPLCCCWHRATLGLLVYLILKIIIIYRIEVSAIKIIEIEEPVSTHELPHNTVTPVAVCFRGRLLIGISSRWVYQVLLLSRLWRTTSLGIRFLTECIKSRVNRDILYASRLRSGILNRWIYGLWSTKTLLPNSLGSLPVTEWAEF